MKDHIAPILEELRKAKEEVKNLRKENARLIEKLELLNRINKRV